MYQSKDSFSDSHRDYLTAGGTTFFLGDGRLKYGPEAILEAFYSVGLGKVAWITADWQRVRNPGYNADRGPVNVGSIRLHAEF